MSSLIYDFLISPVFAIIVGLILAALATAGINGERIARLFVWLAGLYAVAIAYTSLNAAPFRHRLIAAAMAGFPTLIVVAILNRLISRTVRKREKVRAVTELARRDQLLTKYLGHVESNVNTVQILGDSEQHNLNEVFVELTLTNDRERPSSKTQAEYLGLMDAELRRSRSPLARKFGGSNARGPKGRRVQPGELLNSNRRAILAGAPGSGKSTLLRYLAKRTLLSGQNLPVFLELKTLQTTTFDFAQGKLTELLFGACIDKTVCESESDRVLMRCHFFERLNAGTVSIFLDGLDEVSGEQFFAALRLSVKEFLQDSNYRNNSLYISTRPYAIHDRFSDDEAEEMEIEPFNQKQIEKFVAHYYPIELEAGKLLSELRRRPDLREFARVPALLGFMILLFRKHGTAPQERTELYHDVVHQLAVEGDKVKGVSRAFNTTERRRIDFLSHMAFSRLINESGQKLIPSLAFTSLQILKEAERYCELRQIANQADQLAEDVKSTPLLRQVGTDSFAFAHFTIQEYMAATVLSESQNIRRLFCRAYFDSTMSELEILPMTLALANDKVDLGRVLEELPESLDFKSLRLQARALRYGYIPVDGISSFIGLLKGMIINTDVEFGYFEAIAKSFRGATGSSIESIARAVSTELTNSESVYRSYAVRILGFLENETATRLLHDALDDADGSVRIEAALFISQNDNGFAVDTLVKELESSDTEIREESIHALWQLGTGKAIDGLKKGLKDESEFIRRLSLEALTNLTGEAAVPVLIDCLNDADTEVRRVAVKGLGELGDNNTVDALMKASDDRDPAVAEESVWWLGQSGSARVFDFLLDFLETHSGKIVGSAAEALGHIKNVEAIPKLIEMLNKYTRDQSNSNPLFYLTGGWINDYVSVRVAASLIELGDARGKPILLKALSAGEQGVRKYAVNALAKLYGNEIAPLLLRAFDEKTDDDDRIAIANALLDLKAGDRLAIAHVMVSILKTSKGFYDSRIFAAINVLGRTSTNIAVEGLNNALKYNNPLVRLASIMALGRIAAQDELAVEGLLLSLISVNVVSQEAAIVLARMDNPILARGLLSCLESKTNYVRRKAAECIAYYESDEATEAVLTALATFDPVLKVRNAAQVSLTRLERRRSCLARSKSTSTLSDLCVK